MLNFPLMWKSIPLNIFRFINATWFPQLHLSIKIFSRRLLNSLTYLENYVLLLLMIPNPSSMNLLNFLGHMIFFRRHIIYSSSSSIAIYIICIKKSSWNFLSAPFKTISISSKIRCAFGIMFWYLKNNLFMSSVASLTEILVYKLFKFIVNKKQSLENFDISNILIRLKLSVKMFSNLE